MTQAQEHSGSDDHGHGHGHGSRFIQHHYDDAQHQFDSGKLGIWFFLAQEILFFSALFVAYILYRHHHPEIFEYAHHYLDVKWGAINTGVLIVSSLSAAWAVRCAQLNQKRGLIFCLVVTIVCACGFLAIKYVEYSHKIHEHILFGSKFDPCISSNGHHLVTKHNECPGTKSTVEWDFGGHTAKAGCLDPKIYIDPKKDGYQVDCLVEEVTSKWDAAHKTKTEVSRRSLTACPEEAHGHGGHGAEHGEAKAEHAAPKSNDPKADDCFEAQANPLVCPKGPAILALYHDETERGDSISIEATCNPYTAPAAPADPLADKPAEPPTPGEVMVEHRPAKTKHQISEEIASGPPPTNTNMFFSIYFAMTGLHGIHVLVGILVFIWLLIRAMKGHFTADYFGPIDYAALYWHLVDLIWIFLFPMLYLIH